MMALPSCHMHGPEHHTMVGFALLTAYKNAGGEIDLVSALGEMQKRGKQVPGGACGFLGARLATLGVVLPSFIIILLVATLFTKLLKYAGVKAVLGGIKPAIVGMILATALTMFLSVILNIATVQSAVNFDWKGLVIFGVLLVVALGYFKWKKKAFSPILLIVISGVLGVLMYGI